MSFEIIKYQDRSATVWVLKDLLNIVITPSPKLEHNDFFDRDTQAVVRRFQQAKRLKIDAKQRDTHFVFSSFRQSRVMSSQRRLGAASLCFRRLTLTWSEDQGRLTLK